MKRGPEVHSEVLPVDSLRKEIVVSFRGKNWHLLFFVPPFSLQRDVYPVIATQTP